MLDENQNEIEIRELEDDIYATESEFKDELVPKVAPEAMVEEQEATPDEERFDFDEMDLGDDPSLDDDF